jgi:uncharacterized protein
MNKRLTPQAPLARSVTRAVRTVLPQAVAVWLFGSGASDALRLDSDVDIAVMLDQPMSALQIFDYSEALARLLGRNVDLIDFARTSTVLQQQILTAGVRIDCQDAARTDSYEAFCRSEYLRLNAQRKTQLRDVFARGTVLA